MKTYAPGKLILSGEHAVVYGAPALAMAVNRYAVATVTEERLPQILFDLADLAHRSRLSVSGLRDLKSKIKKKYFKFIRGQYSIRQVLQKPFELAQLALGIFVEAFNLKLPNGVKIRVESGIPVGCGMGSSAATILSVMSAVSTHLKLPISQEKLYQLALEAENMQHGQSSGIDLRIAMHGGCLFVHGQEIEMRAMPVLPMYLVNTGTPLSSTGECVEKVKPHFQSGELKNEFTKVTLAMDAALRENSHANMLTAVTKNHQLLCQIGVVPEKVSQFIDKIMAAGGAAKTCGAGAVTGDNAGAVIVFLDDETVLSAICADFNYDFSSIVCETRGVYAV